MKNLITLLLITVLGFQHTSAQTPLTEAVDFSVKTLDSEMIYLFELLDEDLIVVLNFYSTTCGPCQTYAPHFQEAYEIFGMNTGNVFFLNINMNDYNLGVEIFNQTLGITVPSVSGIEGGGDKVYEAYEIMSYPTVIVITPDHNIFDPQVFLPTTENIVASVLEAGGTMVNTAEIGVVQNSLKIYQTGSGIMNIEYHAGHEAQGQIKVYDLQGRAIVMIDNLAVHQGFNTYTIYNNIAKTGIYIVEFSIDQMPVSRELFFNN